MNLIVGQGDLIKAHAHYFRPSYRLAEPTPGVSGDAIVGGAIISSVYPGYAEYNACNRKQTESSGGSEVRGNNITCKTWLRLA